MKTLIVSEDHGLSKQMCSIGYTNIMTDTQMATYLRKYAFGVQVAQLKSEAYAKEVRANKTHQNGLNQHVHKCSCGEVFDVSTQAPQTSLKA